MPYGTLGRLAVVSPAPGVNVNTQLHRNLHPDIGIAGVPVDYDAVTCEGIQAMSERTVEAVKLFKKTYSPDMVFFACTTGSLIGGDGYDRRIAAELREAAGARHASTTTTAVLRALERLRARRLTIVTPYPDEVNERERVYFEHLGYTVDEIAGLGHKDPRLVPKTRPEEIYALAKKCWKPTSEALFVSCTGLCILEVIPGLEAELSVPLVTSNQASVWEIGEFFGHHSPGAAGRLGRLFQAPPTGKQEVSA